MDEVVGMSELKSCPFCGGEAELDEYCGRYVVFCKSEKCSWRDTEAKAIEAWNTRHERTCELIKHAARDEESGIELVLYECGQCGWIVDPSRNERYCPNCGLRVRRDDE